MGKSVIGGTPYAVEARPAASTGIAWSDWCASGYPASASCIRIRVFALTPFIQGRSRMREIRSYGSVRGVVGDRYPYRDSQKTRNGSVARVDLPGFFREYRGWPAIKPRQLPFHSCVIRVHLHG